MNPPYTLPVEEWENTPGSLDSIKSHSPQGRSTFGVYNTLAAPCSFQEQASNKDNKETLEEVHSQDRFSQGIK